MTLLMLSLLLCAAAAGDEPPTPSSPDMIQQLDAQVSRIEESQAALRDEILRLRRSATDMDRKWQGLLGESEQIKSQQRELEKKLAAQQEAAKLASTKHEQATTATVAAQQKLQEAKQRLEEAQMQVTKAAAELEAATKPLAETQSQLAMLASKVGPVTLALTEAESDNNQMRQSIGSLSKREASLANERAAHQKRIETMLRESGQWVSFTDQIAPIFQQRCVACHNVRNSQGRYNMATFDAIQSPGESGPAIVAGMPDESRLLQLIEDGSMPYDADPLTDEQVALIRRWIALGARLDSGAGSSTPLIRLMPRTPQPSPPAQYRASIPVTALAIDPAGQQLASSGYHEVLLWSLPTGTLTGRIANVAERVYGLAYHPDGHRLAVASGTPGQWGEVKVFEVPSGRLVSDLLVSEDAIFDVSYSPDGSQLAAGGADGTIAIFSPDDPQASPTMIADHSDWVNAIAWSRDGRRLASASRDKTAKVFDVQTSERLITFNGHGQNVTDVAFLPDGTRLVSSGEDRRIRVWDIADAKQRREIAGFTGEISRMQVTGDEHVISIGADGKLRIHHVGDGKLIREVAIGAQWTASVAATSDQKIVLLGDQAGQIHRIEFEGSPVVKQSWPSRP
ncbi:MAG: c-type cytochrome domain-containing protein [Planctomycetaceae bacterium]